MPTVDSPEEAQGLARLIQGGKLTGAARDAAMDALRKYDASGATPSGAPQSTPDTLKLGFSRGHILDTHIPIPQGVGNFLGGLGESVMNLGQGVAQDLGLRSRADVQATRDLESYIPKSGARTAGNIAGDVATLLPAAFIPGADTFAGAAAIGAASGLLQPSTSTGETLKNMALGAGLAPVSVGLGRAAGGLYQGVKGAIEPLLSGGQQRIAARTLQAFAGGPKEAAAAAQNLAGAPAVLSGVQPETAELANNAGLAQLSRSLRNQPTLTTAFNARDQANRAAIQQAINSIAGDDASRAAAVATRKATTAPLYKDVEGATVQADDTLRGILARPSMRGAWARAQRLAAENGDELVAGRDVPEQIVNSSVLDESGKPYSTTIPAQSARYSGKAIQYLKMALNDTADTGPQNGMGAHEAAAVRGTLSDLNQWTRDNLPALRKADEAYAALSAPINQMDVGSALRDRLLPALSDFGNSTRLNSASFANALRNGDQLAANTLARKSAPLADVLSPDQLTTLRRVGEQLARRTNAQEMGRAAGSNTAQNLIGQNLIRQILGPLGLPQSLAEQAARSSLGQTIMRPAQWALRMGEQPILEHLGQAALDPSYAGGLLQMRPPTVNMQRKLLRQGLLAPIGAAAANAIEH